MDSFSPSKFNFTLLELNNTFTLSLSTPSSDFTALSIFCMHEGHAKDSNCMVALFILSLLTTCIFLIFILHHNNFIIMHILIYA